MPHSDICRSNMGTVSPHNENMAEADKARIGYRPMLSKKSRELKNVTGSSHHSSQRSRDRARMGNSSTASPTLLKSTSPMMMKAPMELKHRNMREDEQPIMLHNQRLLSNSQESAKVNIEQSSGVDLNSKSDSKTPKSQLRKQRSNESKPKQNSNKSFVDAKFSDSGKGSEESKKKNKTPQREKNGVNMLIVDRNGGNNDSRPTFGKAGRTETDESVGKTNSGPSVGKPGSRPSVDKSSSRPSNIPVSSHSRNKPQLVDEQAQTIKPNNIIASNSSKTPPNPEI